ncbi:hypothetical protein HBB16_20815 [Pseudonocardia sp. MCCB 268]|nr:hypothetical protein [Pseudonocardia cytotoxica]
MKPGAPDTTMKIGEVAMVRLAHTRAAWHWEAMGVLVPERFSGRCSRYSRDDLYRVAGDPAGCWRGFAP